MNRVRKMLILAGGVVLMLMGLFHVASWLNPAWNGELLKLTDEARAAVQMLNLGIITFLIGIGACLAFFSSGVAASPLGRMLLLAAALYFAVRCAAGGYFNHGNALISAVLTLCVLLYLVPALMKNN